MSEPASPALACLLCGSVRTHCLDVAWLPPPVTYFRCSDCAFMWVTNLETGETHAVTVKPETPKDR